MVRRVSKCCYIVGLTVLASFIIFTLYTLRAESQPFQKGDESTRTASKEDRQASLLQSLRSGEPGRSIAKQYDVVLLNEPRYIPPLVIYNRVPKTGSTTFTNIAYASSISNSFNILHINSTNRNFHTFNIIDQFLNPKLEPLPSLVPKDIEALLLIQYRFVRNVSEWTERQPALYHGHMHFLDFTRFGYRNPVYINVVREPLERLISYYYFRRFGDNFRPQFHRSRASDANTTFDDCVKEHGVDCRPEKLWLQVPFFCGHNAECEKPSTWALEQAKSNLLSHYMLVGVTDHLKEFVALLEQMLPSYFSGAQQLYLEGGLAHLRTTRGKHTPSEQTVRFIQRSPIYQLESKFYKFAYDQFQFVLKKVFVESQKEKRLHVDQEVFRFDGIVPTIPIG